MQLINLAILHMQKERHQQLALSRVTRPATVEMIAGHITPNVFEMATFPVSREIEAVVGDVIFYKNIPFGSASPCIPCSCSKFTEF